MVALAAALLLATSACDSTLTGVPSVEMPTSRAASPATPLTSPFATPQPSAASLPIDIPGTNATPATPHGPNADSTVRPAPTVRESFVVAGSEPAVAVGQEGELAVVVQEIEWPRACSRPVVRISRDGGTTWSRPSRPWGRRCEGIHAVTAWGPDHRLWVSGTVGVTGGVRVAITHSDDFGRTWSAPWVEPYTPAWVGSFPAMAVDTDPRSPNYGTVYVAYNWLPGLAGPGVHVLAKPLHGGWAQVEVPPVGLRGYPAHNRIGYRIVPTAAGSVVSFYEADLRRFPATAILSNGSAANVGRQGFATAAIRFDGRTLRAGSPEWATDVGGGGSLYLDPRWQSQLAVDTETGASWTWLTVESHGRIIVGRSQGGGRWVWTTLAAGFKPVLAVSSAPDAGVVFVGWHAMLHGRIQNYWSLSHDDGRTWLPPHLVSGASWRYPDRINGTGLRENAAYGRGLFYWAWADTRSGPIDTYLAAVRF
jgi:hypothetical protein